MCDPHIRLPSLSGSPLQRTPTTSSEQKHTAASSVYHVLDQHCHNDHDKERHRNCGEGCASPIKEEQMVFGRDVTNRSVSQSWEPRSAKVFIPAPTPVAQEYDVFVDTTTRSPSTFLQLDINRFRARDDSDSFFSDISPICARTVAVEVQDTTPIQPTIKKTKKEMRTSHFQGPATQSTGVQIQKPPFENDKLPETMSRQKQGEYESKDQEQERQENSEGLLCISRVCQAVPSVWSSKYLQKYLQMQGASTAETTHNLKGGNEPSTTLNGLPYCTNSDEDEDEDDLSFELDSVSPIPVDIIEEESRDVRNLNDNNTAALITHVHQDEVIYSSSGNDLSRHYATVPVQSHSSESFSEVLTSTPSSQMDHMLAKWNLQNILVDSEGQKEEQLKSADGDKRNTHPVQPLYCTSAFSFAEEWWKMD